MKRHISFLLTCIFLCLPDYRASETEQTFFAMDTVMSVQVSGRREPQVVAITRKAVERLDGLLSRTDPDSQIARLNTAVEDGAVVAMGPDVTGLLAFSQEVAWQLPGDFDITIASVMDAQGFTTGERHVPAPDALVAAMTLVDSEELSVDTEASTTSLARAGMEVDPDAVTKDFTTREAEAAIRDAGGTSAMLDLGGDVMAISAEEDGSPWRVAVKDPRDASSYLRVLALTDVTFSASGGYERYSEEDRVHYHHITGPETGYPADSDLLSITAISADHLLTDAFSTVLFMAGPEEVLNFWQSRDDSELVLYTGQGELLVTEGLKDTFTFAGADRGYIHEVARR